jgi:predicted Ser/Thr protein kinase
MRQRRLCLWCWARFKPSKQRCPKCAKTIVRRIGDRFDVLSCIVVHEQQASLRCWDRAERREVFVRIARPGATPVTIDALTAEAVVLRQLAGQPGFPAQVYAGKMHETGSLYTVQEFVTGSPLETALGKECPAARVEMLLDAFPPVAALHRQGFVHCGLSLRHFLLTPDGHEILLDFRQARREGQPSGGSGVAGYAAPEQWSPMRPVTSATDEFGLGACLYLALTRRFPYGKQRPGVTRARTAPPRKPSELCPDITPDLDDVMLRALAFEAEKRHGSMADFRRALMAAFGPDTVPDAFDCTFPSRWQRAVAAVGRTSFRTARGLATGIFWTLRTAWRTAPAVGRFAMHHPKLTLAGAAAAGVTVLPLVLGPEGVSLGTEPVRVHTESALVSAAFREDVAAPSIPALSSTLRVLTWPPAKVYCDGTLIAEAPSPERIAMRDGEQHMLLVSTRGERRPLTFTVLPDREYVLQYNFDTNELNLEDNAQ